MNKKASDIKLVSLYSTIKMMHGPINIRVLMGLCGNHYFVFYYLVGPHYGICSVSPFWHLKILRWFLDIWKICAQLGMNISLGIGRCSS